MKLSRPWTNRPVKAGDRDVRWAGADLPFVQGYIVRLQRNWLRTHDSTGKQSFTALMEILIQS